MSAPVIPVRRMLVLGVVYTVESEPSIHWWRHDRDAWTCGPTRCMAWSESRCPCGRPGMSRFERQDIARRELDGRMTVHRGLLPYTSIALACSGKLMALGARRQGVV